MPSDQNEITVKPYQDKLLQGHGIVVQYEVSNYELNTLTCSYEQEQFEDSVKKNLARSIAQHLIENGLIEFTKVKNTDRFSMTYKARAFLLGKDGVNYIKNNMKVY